jgi:hypothetical protein
MTLSSASSLVRQAHRQMDKARVQLRSNVVLDGEAWHLVPGDALQQYAPHLLKRPHHPTARQRDEHMYYVPCSICRRLSHEIALEGCNQCSHGPSRAAQDAAIARHEAAQRELATLKQGLRPDEATLGERPPADSTAQQVPRASRILVPSAGAEDWKRFLAEPEKHWRTGYSAKALASCWEAADGFPASVQALFDASPFEELHRLEMLLGIPEHRVPLPGGSRASQTDLFVLARARDGLAAIAVEGKVSEPFGPRVREWLAPTPSSIEGEPDIPPSSGKRERIEFVCSNLGLAEEDVADARYQLLHRTVSALIEAERFGARHAVMLVHSFSPMSEWFDDYKRFAALLGADGKQGELVRVRVPGDVRLYLGWATGEASYLTL